MCDWTVIAIRVSAVDFFFFNDTATTEIYPLSLHDALPISRQGLDVARELGRANPEVLGDVVQNLAARVTARLRPPRSEEHTSEPQSQSNNVFRLLLGKKNTISLRVAVSQSFTVYYQLPAPI